jgi:hypothetical protein
MSDECRSDHFYPLPGTPGKKPKRKAKTQARHSQMRFGVTNYPHAAA